MIKMISANPNKRALKETPMKDRHAVNRIEKTKDQREQNEYIQHTRIEEANDMVDRYREYE